MKNAWLSLALLALLLGILTWGIAGNSPPDQLEAKTGLGIGQPIRYENLTIFPVVVVHRRMNDRFLTLDEGLKAGTIEVLEAGATSLQERSDEENLRPNNQAARQISGPIQAEANPFAEVLDQEEAVTGNDALSQAVNQQQVAGNINPFGDAGNDVNHLVVINRSEKPLYLMPGEILLGGDQDRAIGQELVIAPNKKAVVVDVFCVEHGRWGDRESAELGGYLRTAAGNAANAGSVALDASLNADSQDWSQVEEAADQQAKSGKFLGSLGSLNKAARLAVQEDKSQSRVWDEVENVNAQGSVKSRSGAFTGNYAEGEAVKRLEPFIQALQKPIEETPQVVGVIVAFNGSVESLDIFESTPLFQKLWPKLIKSYALDAVNAKHNATNKVCRFEEARSFLEKAAQTNATKVEAAQGVHVASQDSDDLIVFSAHQKPERATQVIPMTDSQSAPSFGFGGAIHSAGYSK